MPNEVISSQTSATHIYAKQRIINDEGRAEQAVLCVSRAMSAIPGLESMLGVPVVHAHSPWVKVRGAKAYRRAAQGVGAVLAWGNKASSKASVEVATALDLPVLRLEDGFLRSVELGAHEPPLGIVLDDLGIYYDARRASRLEQLIQQPLNDTQKLRASNLMAKWRAARVSKYNHCAEKAQLTGVDLNQSFVLVVDQTFGDASITYGLADATRFIEMLEAAIERYPAHTILVKTHPDVVAGLKQGHFDDAPESLTGKFVLVGEDIHAPALIERAAAVFCVTSQMGFEALLWEKPVYVFGMPFFAGWGLTHDALPRPERRQDVSIEQLVHAALIDYARYLHPDSGKVCQIEALLDWMGEQRRQRNKVSGNVLAINWPRWKKPVLRTFMQGAELRFVDTPKNRQSTSLNENVQTAKTVGWGARATTSIRVEDGFIRSVGLGADLTLPQSWVIDDVGMYYDASRPSRLEVLLKETVFTDEMRAQGARLQEKLLVSKVTKYNVGHSNWQRPSSPKRVVLVPGQVESDASIQLGSPHLKSNIELLSAARASCPDAYIVYKPHPDVLAGLRVAGQDRELAQTLCDEIITDQDMAWMLQQVDEVHTMTSLTGFEALLRGIPVTCYGQPFYSGWGLTDDRYPLARRQRTLRVEELVMATLVLYPSYINYQTGRFTTAEFLIEQLSQQREVEESRTHGVFGLLRRWMRVVKRKVLSINRF